MSLGYKLIWKEFFVSSLHFYARQHVVLSSTGH